MKRLIFSNAVGYRFLRHVGFWSIIFAWYFLGLASINFMGPETKSRSVLDFIQQFRVSDSLGTITYILQMFITTVPSCYALAYWFVPRLIATKKLRTFTLWLFLIMLVNHGALLYWGNFPWGGTLEDKLIALWYSFLMAVNLGAPIVCGLFIGMKMLKTWSLAEQEKIVLSRESAIAELQLLKAQIHPHFLFNALNNIYSFSLNRSQTASHLVSRLSDIVEYMTNDCDESMVQLDREIKMIVDYIGLEKVRYGSRLKLEVNIDANSSSDLLIPPLLLIPFVENSFKHGASEALNDPWIDLRINTVNDELLFRLTNGQPDAEVYRNPRKGLGLNNVRKRLELLFPGKDNVLTIVNDKSYFEVTLKLPLVKRMVTEELAIAV